MIGSSRTIHFTHELAYEQFLRRQFTVVFIYLLGTRQHWVTIAVPLQLDQRGLFVSTSLALAAVVH